ncbi:unnamed protein product [Merluccius merluccius]
MVPDPGTTRSRTLVPHGPGPWYHTAPDPRTTRSRTLREYDRLDGCCTVIYVSELFLIYSHRRIKDPTHRS